MPIESESGLRAILEQANTIAVVGLSDRPERPSYGVAGFLLQQGYRIIPVNPRVDAVLGIAAVDSLAEIDEHIDIVDVFRRSEFAPEIARQAVAIGAGTLWLQEGVINDVAMRTAEEGGLNAVQDFCIAVAYRLLGVHRP